MAKKLLGGGNFPLLPPPAGAYEVQQNSMNTVYFFDSANSLTLNTVCTKNGLSRQSIDDTKLVKLYYKSEIGNL